MIQQLITRLMAGVAAAPGLPALPALTQPDAATAILMADPLDLIVHMEQVYDQALPWGPWPNPPPAGPARRGLWAPGAFSRYVPALGVPAWDHLAYGYILENTRAVQIFRRVVREYRSGEGLGVPTVPTQRWLDTTESLLFGAANPISPWLSTSVVRQDPEAVRRNAYWRLFGLDLAFGQDDNRPPVYDKSNIANGGFLSVFEELLYELWKAMTNTRNTSGENNTDDDRIYQLTEQLSFILRSRRQYQILAREELAAATALGWLELTLSTNSPVVVDLKATATSAGDRLKAVGERVGLAPHSKASSFFSMSSELSLFLRVIESNVITSGAFSWVLYLNAPPFGALPGAPPPIGNITRRVITEWAAASGKDFKARARPVEVRSADRRLVAAR